MSKENSLDLTKIVAIVALAVVLIVAAFAVTTGPKEVNVYNTGEDNLNLLSVNGTVSKEFAPDRAEIVLSIVTTNKDAALSQQENADKATSVMNALKLAGVKNSEIETTGYNVRTEYEWDRTLEKSVLKGYTTTNTIKITLSNLSIVGKVVDAAVDAGANNVSNISFTLSEEAQLAAKNEVLREAAANAKAKAQNIASGLGVQIGEVHSISENSYYYQPVYKSYDTLSAVAEDAGSITPISESDVSVSATVSVQFEI